MGSVACRRGGLRSSDRLAVKEGTGFQQTFAPHLWGMPVTWRSPAEMPPRRADKSVNFRYLRWHERHRPRAHGCKGHRFHLKSSTMRELEDVGIGSTITTGSALSTASRPGLLSPRAIPENAVPGRSVRTAELHSHLMPRCQAVVPSNNAITVASCMFYWQTTIRRPPLDRDDA